MGRAPRACPSRCSPGTCRRAREAAAAASCGLAVLGERRRADEPVHAEPQLASSAYAAAEAAKQPPPVAGRPHAAGMAKLKGRIPTRLSSVILRGGYAGGTNLKLSARGAALNQIRSGVMGSLNHLWFTNLDTMESLNHLWFRRRPCAVRLSGCRTPGRRK